MGSVADQVLRISRNETSPEYLSYGEPVEHAGRPDRHLYVYDVDRSNPVAELTDPAEFAGADADVQGFTLTGSYDREAYAAVVSVPVEDVLSRTPLEPRDFPLSQFNVMAVDAEHTGKGIGSPMSAGALVPLFEDPPVTVMVWERDNPANVKLAERYANNRLVRFPDYFDDDRRCPDCGFENRCGCAVTMYGWFADGRRELPLEE